AGIGDREVVVGAGEHRIEHAVGKVFRGDRVVAADRGRTVALEHLRRGDGEVAGRGEGPERLDVAIAHDQFDAAAVELDVARATGVVQQDVALAARHARAHDQVPGTVEAGTGRDDGGIDPGGAVAEGNGGEGRQVCVESDRHPLCGEHRIGPRRLHGAGHADVRSQQVEAAAVRGQLRALSDHDAVQAAAGQVEAQVAVEEIRVGDARGGQHQSAHVEAAGRADRDAVGVEDPD